MRDFQPNAKANIRSHPYGVTIAGTNAGPDTQS